MHGARMLACVAAVLLAPAAAAFTPIEGFDDARYVPVGLGTGLAHGRDAYAARDPGKSGILVPTPSNSRRCAPKRAASAYCRPASPSSRLRP